jgi:hypothetical protein
MTDTGCKEKRNWSAWHDQYEDKSSPLIHRLSVVQREIRRALPRQLNRSFSIISICAGQGNDVIPVLGEYGHVQRVRARLVEVDPSSIGKLRDKINAAGLNHLEVMQADAADTDVYRGMVPADLVLLCGVFGNISDADIHNTIGSLPQLCRIGSTAIWTRSRRAPDITPTIRQWFRESDFEEITFYAPDGELFTVGTQVFRGQPLPLQSGRLFTFLV